MKVKEVMTGDPDFCSAGDNLTKAAYIMWSRDCGIVPVVDDRKVVIGVITDRDISIAAASRNRLTSEIRACEMNFAPLKVCSPNDDVKDVLRRMRKYKIKRLCVTGEGGELLGMISLTDILLKAGDKKSVRKLIFSTLTSIAKPAPIVLKAAESENAENEDEQPDVEIAETEEEDDGEELTETETEAEEAES